MAGEFASNLADCVKFGAVESSKFRQCKVGLSQSSLGTVAMASTSTR